MRSFWSLHFATKTFISSQNLLEFYIFKLFNDFLKFPIPPAPSRSNHYVDKAGGYHNILICTLNPSNASPWIETCLFSSIRVGPSSPITGLSEQSAKGARQKGFQGVLVFRWRKTGKQGRVRISWDSIGKFLCQTSCWPKPWDDLMVFLIILSRFVRLELVFKLSFLENIIKREVLS